MSRQMDPDRFQMRDLKRRISKLEDHIGYLKTDLKRETRFRQVLESEIASVMPILKALQKQAGGPPTSES